MKLRGGAVAGIAILAMVAAGATVGPALTAGSVSAQHPDFVLAPPMLPHIVDSTGSLRLPFIYPLALEDRLTQAYTLDLAHPQPICWFCDGHLLSTGATPWFPLGTDRSGRDVLARLLAGARLSLGIALTATTLALLVGAFVGGIAGMTGGAADAAAMRVVDFVVTLPALYVVITLRSALPLVISTQAVFWTVAGVLAVIGWPVAARGVRAIVMVERGREYAEAARAAGAGRTRILLRHLLPAAYGFLAMQAVLLIPAFVLAEATLSYVGLGFPEETASWGGMLHDAAGDVGSFVRAPWLLAPAVGMVAVVLGINLIASTFSRPRAPLTIP